MAVEVIVIAAAWAIQIAAVLLVAAVIAAAAKIAEEAFRKKSVKLLPRLLVIFLLLCAILIALAVNPIVICSEDLESELTGDMRDRVRGGAAGLYSEKIPLVPLFARVTGIENRNIDGAKGQKVEFFVYYFCLGKMRMEYDTRDGYNSYPLFALQ